MVTASTGLDVLCHALESFLMIPYDAREAPASPADRKPYCGSNPVSDVWCRAALRLVTDYLERATADGGDREARYHMLLASTMAGYGFGNAGVHIPHAMSYPIASRVRSYVAPDYDSDHPLVPHGVSVVLGAPAAFRFAGATMQQRHLEAAALIGCDTKDASAEDGGELIARRLIELMRKFGLPNGLSGVGYAESDIPALVQGAMKQQRILVLSPRPVTDTDMSNIFRSAMRYW
jgi:hydroxyacid-oxoacid transhydrogenase